MVTKPNPRDTPSSSFSTFASTTVPHDTNMRFKAAASFTWHTGPLDTNSQFKETPFTRQLYMY
jgi:hypothetical protein